MELYLGENIRKYRRAMNITQEQLAERLGVSYQAVSRWENGTTYPDIELLPALADFFSVTVDTLLGFPEAEKEKKADEAFTELRKACIEPSADTKKINGLIREIRRNYLDSQYMWRFWGEGNHNRYRLPDVLPEVRLTAEAFMEKNINGHSRESVIELMADIEDDEHIDAFMDRYATDRDLSKDTLLRHRYYRRGEWKKYEDKRQLCLYLFIDELVDGKIFEYHGKSGGANAEIESCECRLELIRIMSGGGNDDLHPVSGGGRVDFWVYPRIDIGIHYGAALASVGENERAFTVLCDTVHLIETAMRITKRVELRSASRWLDRIVFSAEEIWHQPHNDPLEDEERCILIIDKNGYCYVLFTSWILDMLVSDSRFDPIRCDARYGSLVDRVKSLVIKRKADA